MTAAEGKDGKDGPPVYVPIGTPTIKGRSHPAAFEAACQREVYENGNETYGNKDLVVLTIERRFRVPFVRRDTPTLVPPPK